MDGALIWLVTNHKIIVIHFCRKTATFVFSKNSYNVFTLTFPHALASAAITALQTAVDFPCIVG